MPNRDVGLEHQRRRSGVTLEVTEVVGLVDLEIADRTGADIPVRDRRGSTDSTPELAERGVAQLAVATALSVDQGNRARAGELEGVRARSLTSNFELFFVSRGSSVGVTDAASRLGVGVLVLDVEVVGVLVEPVDRTVTSRSSGERRRTEREDTALHTIASRVDHVPVEARQDRKCIRLGEVIGLRERAKDRSQDRTGIPKEPVEARSGESFEDFDCVVRLEGLHENVAEGDEIIRRIDLSELTGLFEDVDSLRQLIEDFGVGRTRHQAPLTSGVGVELTSASCRSASRSC